MHDISKANAGAASDRSDPRAVTIWIVFLLAISCGLLVANNYYAQPLAGPIGVALGLQPEATGLIVTLTQIGYGAGLFLITPLGDLFENRKLAVGLICIAAVGLLAAGLSHSPLAFLVAAFVIGLGAVAAQVLIPYAAHLAPEAVRGRVVGYVMFGLMLGVMLARPVSSFIAQISSWHIVFFASAAAMVMLAVVLVGFLPPRRPVTKLRYGELLGSMGRLVLTTPALRRRALYHACLFAAFQAFWTTTPLLLAGPFHLSQGGIALFALAGVAGAVAAPIAGHVADRGWTRVATGLAISSVAFAFLVTHIAPEGSPLALGLLVVAAMLVDFGVSANMTLGQRTIFALGADYRARLNAIYMTIFFIGGAIGSALGGWAYASGGWTWTSWLGFALPVAALVYFATERNEDRARSADDGKEVGDVSPAE